MNKSTVHKEDALQDIVALAQNNNISLGEIAQALTKLQAQVEKPSASILSKLLGYIGGIFVFAGISIFISMYWQDFGSAARVIVTLGIGFVLFVMALACLQDTKYERAATPFFLMAAFLQPSGIFVMLDEYATGGDVRYGILFMALYMLIQQGATFYAKRQTLLAFFAIFFSSVFLVTLFDVWDMNEKLIGTVIGASLMCMAYALNQSRHLAIAAFWYVVGSIVLLSAVFAAVKATPFELAYLGISAWMIFLSTYVRSRSLLVVSTLSMLCYVGYYTAEHFANVLGWPIALVMIGVALIAISAFAVKLNRKYMQ